MSDDGIRLIEGTVKFFKEDRGYGFIETERRDYFVHFRYIVSDGHKTLVAGQKVKFLPGTSPKGHVATNVEII